MNEIGGVNSVLAQIRALRSQIDGATAPVTTGAAPKADFTSALSKAVDQVSKTQDTANTMADAFERGDSSSSVAQVMLSMQKAQVSFKALTEVRNRLVQAYQDVQNMPL